MGEQLGYPEVEDWATMAVVYNTTEPVRSLYEGPLLYLWDMHVAGLIGGILQGRCEHMRDTSSVLCMLEHAGHLWSGSDDETVRLWNVHTGECVRVIQTKRSVGAMCVWRGNVVGVGAYCVWNSAGDQMYQFGTTL